ARSVGVVLTYGNFRMIDIGDLTWNKEHDLVCPNNLLGNVDLYLTTHHGLDISGSPAVVHALRPRVAIMNNGAKKGGTRSAWQTVRDSPGLLDFWQLHFAVDAELPEVQQPGRDFWQRHFAVDAGVDHNTAEPLIANLDETTGYGIKVSVQRDGSFTVTNARNGHAKTYRPRS